ncbi:NADPH-dependent FMN reductase [Actinomarinicola tropica]|uniref:NADPH-dependent FMN reductase n=1 Tax=Actinomarinicola tropica TaxID=2789776 RepID=A0A5Q2RR53_9ACTN|nr:NADPH-dependent FMN reductase [Actinomarinicola tropica]
MHTTTSVPSHHPGHGPRRPGPFVVVSSSVREDRVSPSIAKWVCAALVARDVDVDLMDLSDVELPDDALLQPGGGPRSQVADRIDAAAAFVFVTPEYNHSYPASLKRLIDWHYREWMFKPATIVSYGAHGGHAAVEHLRGVLAELHVVATRRTVSLVAPWANLDASGGYTASDASGRALDGALAELRWWSEVLGEARATRPIPA